MFSIKNVALRPQPKHSSQKFFKEVGMYMFGGKEIVFKFVVYSESIPFNLWRLQNKEKTQVKLHLLTSEINSVLPTTSVGRSSSSPRNQPGRNLGWIFNKHFWPYMKRVDDMPSNYYDFIFVF